MLAEETPARFVAFDLLALGDERLHRRARSPSAARAARAGAGRRPAAGPPDPGDHRPRRSPSEWFEQFEGAGLDGLIAKPLDGRTSRTSGSCSRSSTSAPPTAWSPATGCTRAGRTRSARCCSACTTTAGTWPASASSARSRWSGARSCSTSCSRWSTDVRRAPVGTGPRTRRRGAVRRRGRGEPVERRQGPVLRAAAAGARGRGQVRPHGGHPVPAHRAVRPLAAGPRPGVLHLRAARGAGKLRPGGDPRVEAVTAADGTIRRLDLGYFVRPGERDRRGRAAGGGRCSATWCGTEAGLLLFDTGIGAVDAETEAHYRPRRRPLEVR